MNKRPPKYPLRFFRWFCNPEYVDDIEGDLLERFEKSSSRWRFTYEVVKLMRPSLMKRLSGNYRSNNYGMFKHYFKIGYRNLTRRKSIAFLNIAGLLIGLTIALLIGLWIEYELSFNTTNENYDRVAMVRMQETINGDVHNSVSVPYPLHVALKNEYADDFEHVVYSTWLGNMVVSHDETAINAYGGFMGVGAPELMSLNMIEGNRKSLSQRGSVLLSESLAKALFGDKDPIGKTIKAKRNWHVTVTGIYRDIPINNSFHGVNVIVDWDFFEASTQWRDKTSWSNATYRLYALLRPGVSLDEVNEKISDIVHAHVTNKDEVYETKVFLHPMRDWHLRSNWENGIQTGGDIQYVWWFGVIGTFILLLACVNYMNLNTAQSMRRAKEVGIRKSIGTMRNQLIAQFLTESILTVFIAFLIAIVLTFLVLPYFNTLLNNEITIPLTYPAFWAAGIGFTLLIGVLAGSYPAFYLSSFKPTQILKRSYQNTLSAVFLRKFLVVFQFTIAVVFIIGTMVVSQQINYATNRPLGYDQSGILSIRMDAVEHWSTNNVYRNELLASGLITQFTNSSAPITGVWTENGDIFWEGMDPNREPWFCTYHVNPNYGQTINWEIIAGRDFSEELSSDSSAMIINEAAAKYMQLDEPIGLRVQWSKDYKVIGVVKDLLIESPFSHVRPTVYVFNQGDMSNFQLIKLNPNTPVLKAIAGIEEIHKKHLQNIPFQFDFVDDLHSKKFRKVEQVASFSRIFAILAVCISCLGLFGLASFMVEHRTKEIGIRKVLGASLITLWRMLSSEFVVLVLISCAMAAPLAFYGMNEWLNDYEYRTPMNGWIFFIACLLTLVITIITVSTRSIRVANTNPAEILKDE